MRCFKNSFFIILLFVAVGMQAQENKLLNPGFENATLTNWGITALTGANGTVSISTNAHTGNQSCIVTTTETNGLINKFSLKSSNYVSNGTSFEAKVMAKTDAAGVAAGLKFKIQFIAVSATLGPKYFASSEFVLTENYTAFTFTKELGLDDVTDIKITFQCGGFLGNYYFDDASLIDTTPIPEAIVITPVEITPITRIATTNKVVAFTFDDGPDASLTSQITKLFEDNGGRATFFNIGNKLSGNESVVQEILNEGHELGNHTMSHARVPDLASDEDMYNEIVDFQELYSATFKYTPKLFRAPFLDYGQIRTNDTMTPDEDNRVGGVLTSEDLVPINASVYANDASGTTVASDVYAKLNGNISNGDIILCHERTHTLEALQTLIPELKAAGFTFVTVSELLTIEQGWSTMLPTDARIKIEGSNFIKNKNNELQLHRHSDAVYAGSNTTNLFNPISARTNSGVVIKFKTNSPKVNVKFRMAEGKDENPTFGIFQNNEFIDTNSFPYVSEGEILVETTSQHPGEEVVYKITLPTFTDVHFTGIEVEEGYDLISFSAAVKPIYVAYGNSITHGRGQSSTHETYPYLLAEKLGYELFNLGVGGAKTSQVMAEMVRDEFDHIDMMTILIGYNDYNGEGITAATYETRYRNVINTIREKHPTTKLYCITMTYTTNHNSKKTGIAADTFRNVVKTIVDERKLAGDSAVYLIEGDEITDENDLNDPVHLNVEGANNFANGLFTKIISTQVSNEIHVKKKGDDQLGDGSNENPFATIQKASAVAEPGDTVYVHEGTYRNSDFGDDDIWEGDNLVKITANGTPENYITFMPFPGDKVLLEFDATYGVLFSDASYIKFNGFELKGIAELITQEEANNAWGWYKKEGVVHDLAVDLGIDITDPNLIDTELSKTSDSSIKKPSYYNGRAIVANSSHHIDITNNIVRDVPSSAIRAQQSDYINIIGNEIFNNTYWTTLGVGAITVAESTVNPAGDTFTGTKISIEKNNVHHNENRMISWNPGKSFVNFVIDEGTGIFLTRNKDTYAHGYIKIANNLSYKNGASGIVCHVTDRAIIEHNTVYKNGTTNTSAPGGIGVNNVDDVIIKNNISYASPNKWAIGILANPVTNLVVESNIVFNEQGTESIHKNIADGWIETAPEFIDAENGNFELSGNSPAIDAGNTNTEGSEDFFGAKRTDGKPDIGAIESTMLAPNQLIKKMGRGINLGNTLSAPVEGNWSAVVYEQYFIEVAEQGFTNVRIPIDFYGDYTSGNTQKYSSEANTSNQYNGSNSDYVVDASYLNRIEEVIQWSLNQGLITILDFHGNGLGSEFLRTFDDGHANFTEPSSAKRLADRAKFRIIWATISNRFKDYSDNLLFEIVNEPYFDIGQDEMNDLNTDIIHVIRNSGGLNATRKIIITGGGKNAYEAPLQIAPEIVANDKNLIATFHYYLPRNFTVSSREGKNDFDWGSDEDKAEINSHFEIVKNWSNEHDIPVLLGEFGADNEEGYKYSTGEYGDFGGPEHESRVNFHGYIAERAIDVGFAFSVWDAGNKSNKTIHKRTDNPETYNYYPDGSRDMTTWVEEVKNALLGIQFDDDNDGVFNVNDACPNTEEGIAVDSNGCAIMTLSTNNFEITAIGETCSSSNNGSITIAAQTNFTYTATLQSSKEDIQNNFNNETVFSNLTSGMYELCITISEIANYKQCYQIEIVEPESLQVSSKLNVSKAQLNLKLSGAKKFNINLNGTIFTTSSNEITLDLIQAKNDIKVTTDKDCQGVYNESILLENDFLIYPNPTSDIINITSNIKINAIHLFNQLGQEIKVKYSDRETHKQLDISNLPNGVYYLSINGNSNIIVKK